MKPYYEEKGITIYHGDCREILPTLEPVDLVLTDPPYGTGWITGGGRKAGQFKGRSTHEKWDVWSTEWLNVVRTSYYAIFCPDVAIHSLAQCLPKYRLRYYIKTNPRPSMAGHDSPSVEPIFVAPRVRFGSKAHFTAYNGDAVHPCQKPIDLIRWLAGGMAKTGESILDPFMGSGTTLRAAKDLGLRAIGIEIEEKYCEIAAERLRQEVFDFSMT